MSVGWVPSPLELLDGLDDEMRRVRMDADAISQMNLQVRAAELAAAPPEEEDLTLLEITRGSGMLVSLAPCGRCELK